ncbi:hypothetical protein [Deinococcus sp.]|uniref:hypothetical protein n=1 Tax=Deinococcus sp. TaxID=47478 RepID=UPI003CC5501F
MIYIITSEDVQRITEIDSRLKNSSPGVWEAWIEGETHESGDSFIRTNALSEKPGEIYLMGASKEDIAFISKSKSDIDFLLSLIKKELM